MASTVFSCNLIASCNLYDYYHQHVLLRSILYCKSLQIARTQRVLYLTVFKGFAPSL